MKLSIALLSLIVSLVVSHKHHGDHDDHGHRHHGHDGDDQGHHGHWHQKDDGQGNGHWRHHDRKDKEATINSIARFDESEEFLSAKDYANKVELPSLMAPPPECPQHIGPPCPRYYNNTMKDYTPGDNPTISSELRQQMTLYLNVYIEQMKNYLPTDNSMGPSIMTGTAGQAALFLRLFKNSNDKDYLMLAKQYLEAALNYTTPTPSTGVGFLESYTGVYTIASIIYHEIGDETNSQKYINLLKIAMTQGNACNDDTYDTGRSGLLMAARMINIYFNSDVIPRSDIVLMAYQILENGINTGTNGVLSWKNQVYPNIVFWGQGHGSTGVIHQLLQIPEIISNQTAAQYIKNTLDYYLTIQLPDGNFPTPQVPPYPDQPDELVQWCHGAPGFMPVLTLGSIVFGNDAYLKSADKASDHVWDQGILSKGLMLCHGVSGNTYMFLYMYQKTLNLKYLYRAIKFQEYTLSNPIMYDPNMMRIPTPSPYMFFDGSYAGAIVLWSDMLTGLNYHMPGFDPYP